MSVLIRGMEMPKNCAECERWSICKHLNDYEDYESILYAVEDGDLVKADGCPLVEIPTPHGRLGDLDALVKTLEQNRLCYVLDIDDESFELGTNRAIDVVRNTNTIIEAED